MEYIVQLTAFGFRNELLLDNRFSSSGELETPGFVIKKFPFYQQLDQMDCDPTCLRMIAKFYGKHYSLTELRNKSFITREGVSMLGINQAAEAIGFRTVGVKLSLQHLVSEAPLPCIVHWNQQHFVVVYKIRKKSIYVADPSSGLLTYSPIEFEKSWISGQLNGSNVGVALLLEPTPKFHESDSQDLTARRKTIHYILEYARLHRKLIAQLAIGLLAGSLIQLILPFLTQSIVDIGIRTQNINFVYLVLIGQMVLFFSRATVDIIRKWILLHLSTRINISLVSEFLLKLFRLPISFFEGKMIGDILKRIEDHSRVQRFISSSALNIFFSFFNLSVFGLVLAIYNISILLVFVFISTFYIVFILLFMKRRSELDYKSFQNMVLNQSSLIQNVRGMNEIKLNNCETYKRWEWERIQAKAFNINILKTRLQQYQDAGSLFINESKNMIITAMAATAVVNGEMTLGMMLAIQYLIGQLNAPLNDFINFVREWQDAKISMERIGEISALQDEEDEKDEYSKLQYLPSDRAIIIKNLSFQYAGPESPKVLDDIDLIIPEGKITAIVGGSGSGKTTFIKLLLKFYQPTKGNITIGGKDFRRIPAHLWREHCGVVMQDGFIFSDTISRNIVLSDEAIDRKRLSMAVEISNIKEFIESLPLGYNTKIGENGSGLSHGQKQRILIARAVYKNPEFIFFDEATSALDANNEAIIMRNLNDFFSSGKYDNGIGKTVIIVAHRLSTVRNAHQAIVLDRGKIVEVGSHAELTSIRGSYYTLVKNQLELGN